MRWHAARCRAQEPGGGWDLPCRFRLGTDGLVLEALGRPGIHVCYADIERLAAVEDALQLELYDGRRYALHHLGQRLAGLYAHLDEQRRVQLVRQLPWLAGSCPKAFRGAYALLETGPLVANGGAPPPCAPADVVLYDTALVILPETGDPCWLSYADLEELSPGPGAGCLVVHFDLGDQLVLTLLGERSGELADDLAARVSALDRRTAEVLREHLPPRTADWCCRRLARHLRLGKAANRAAVEAIAPDLWPCLEAAVLRHRLGGDPDAEAVFGYLQERTAPEWACLGIRGAYLEEGEVPRPLFWFAIALPAHNCLAVEVTSDPDPATYFFRLSSLAGPVTDGAFVMRRLRQLNRAMRLVDFRPEVFGLGDDALAGHRFARYRLALRKYAYVRRLRREFLGRAPYAPWPARRHALERLLAEAAATP